MQRRNSTRNLIIFWILALIFLAGFYCFLKSGKNIKEFFGSVFGLEEKKEEIIQNFENSPKVDWTGDYLMISEYNPNVLETGKRASRVVEYSVDFSKEKPEAVLKISLENINENSNQSDIDSHSYFRVYVPNGSWLWKSENINDVSYEEENGKKVFAFNVENIPGKIVVAELRYALPESIESDLYKLLLQKKTEAGILPVKIQLTDAQGKIRSFSLDLRKEYIFDIDKFPKKVEVAEKTENSAPAKITKNPQLIPTNGNVVVVAEAPKAKAPVKKITAPVPYVFKKDQSGRMVCNKKNDHPQKSEQNKKKHMDMECCLDPDETPNLHCYYSQEKYGKYL